MDGGTAGVDMPAEGESKKGDSISFAGPVHALTSEAAQHATRIKPRRITTA
jgi:hypothetical protein